MIHEGRQPVAVITGASAGVGKSTARMLAESGWHVIGVGRNPERTANAEHEVQAVAAGGARVDFVRADFDAMTDVCRVASDVAEIAPKIDILINNAGGVRDRLVITAEGLEATFASNHLAPFLLTRQLLPALRAATTDRPRGAVRVLAVSSSGHKYSPAFDWETWREATPFTPGSAYCRAKLANIMFTRELARRVAPDGIAAHAMHPGDVDSNFHSHANQEMRAHSKALELVSPDEPAKTLVWLSAAAEAGSKSGRYFHKCAEEEPSAHALDDNANARLWTESENLLRELGV